MTREQLQQIAALVKPFGGKNAQILLDVSRDGRVTDALAAIEGAHRRQSTHRPDASEDVPYVILSARIDVDGVEFRAQWSRPATPDEIATLAPPVSTC